MTDLRTAAQQALEALEAGLDVSPILAGEAEEALRAALAQEQVDPTDPGFWGRVAARQASRIKLLEVVAQQALEALEYAQQDRECPSTTRQAITALRAALAQEQAEPLTGLDMFLDPQDELKPKRYKLKAEPAQEQAKPLNLRDRAVQRRLAAQWGYVPAQDEPAQESVAYTTGHCENHKQKGGCQLHNLQCGWPDCDRKPAIVQPRRTLLPLTEKEISEYADKHLRYQPESYEASGVFDLARAVEKASWEKNK